jgi:hypothetical protein
MKKKTPSIFSHALRVKRPSQQPFNPSKQITLRHEFATPLTIITLNIHLLKEQLIGTPAEKNIEKILAATRTLQKLIDKL